MTVIRLTGVTRRFVMPGETVTALDDVSFEVNSGEIIGVVGPSGSGKSTLLNIVVGWDRADGGHVERTATPWTGWHELAVVPQDLGLLAELTTRQNVALADRLAAGTGHDIDGLCRSLGLDELTERLPGELSLGEQQRVAVARAVVASPALLVADEPTAHQDERNADRVMEALVEVVADSGAVIVATHDERLLEHVDRVVRLVDGRVLDG